MYTKEEVDYFDSQLNLYFDDGVKKLMEATKLTRPTITKFLSHQPIKPSNEELIYECGVKLIKEKVEVRDKMVNSFKRITRGKGSVPTTP